MLTVIKIILLPLLWSVLITSISCLASDSTDQQSNESIDYLLEKVAQAPQVENDESRWLQLFEQPGNSQHYYIANTQGKIYQLDHGSSQNALLALDLQQVNTLPEVQLSAFTLHPNFSVRDQPGCDTFYTAHVEKASTKLNTKRLTAPEIKTALLYDAVVTEWRLNDERKVKLSSQREVVRIAINSARNAINQLSFNPYTTSWDDNFGQLYISLSPSTKYEQFPLYSGVILRINPQSSNNNSYTIPLSNPFYADTKYEQSLYLFGAGKIQQFLWPEKYSPTLLVSHQYPVNGSVKNYLSYSDGGEDWREYGPKGFLPQNIDPLSANSLLLYHGQNAPALRSKLLLLTQYKSEWLINSIAERTRSDENIKAGQTELLSSLNREWLLKQNQLQTTHLSLYLDNRGELLFFDEITGSIFQVFQQDYASYVPPTQRININGTLVVFIILMTLLLAYLLRIIHKQINSAKSFVRRTFSGLAVTDDGLAIALYRRHKYKVQKRIAISDIVECKLLLGNQVIATINNSQEHGFCNKQEDELREIFHTEYIDKMVDGKMRRISIVLNSHDKNKYVICLYLRKGSDRITKKSYYEVVDDTMDWCWLIAKNINSEQTGQRAIKTKLTAADLEKSQHRTHDDIPLHTQAAIIRPATHAHDQHKVEKKKAKEGKVNQPLLYKEDNAESTQGELDVVNAIEKLVKLQQQGFLDDDEFIQAKAKLLGNVSKVT
jgi:hypothetical protein